jgi:endonuclease YncB( thermonuclease family)
MQGARLQGLVIGLEAKPALERFVRNRDVRCEIREVAKLNPPIGRCRANDQDLSADIMKLGLA